MTINLQYIFISSLILKRTSGFQIKEKKIMFENIRKPSAELAEGYLNPVTKHL